MKSGSPSWTRTNDLGINSPALYQLSYRGKEPGGVIAALRRLSKPPIFTEARGVEVRSGIEPL